MTDRRKRFSGDFKAKIALEAIKGFKTVAEIASEHGVHPNQITQWKKQAVEFLPKVLEDKRGKQKDDQQALISYIQHPYNRLKGC